MADQKARDELRRLLDAAAGRLLDAGLTWDEVVVVLRRRLGPVEEPPPNLFGVPVGATLNTGGSRWRRDPDGPAGQVRGHRETGQPDGAPVTEPPPWHAEVDEAVEKLRQPADAPGEPPVGSVVTDTRSRVCWRDEAGWHRSDGQEGGAERPLRWADIVQAVGGPADPTPRPGQPTVISSPPPRAQVEMTVRPAGQLETVVQRALLGPDGEPLLGPDGRKQLITETETVRISEVVPAGGRP